MVGKRQRRRTQMNEENGIQTEEGQAKDKDYIQEEQETQTLESSKNIFNLTRSHLQYQSILGHQTINNMNTFAVIALT